MGRTFGVITTCKGRLDHLKVSLPQMVAQRAHEVIVVDYSCPQGCAQYVREHYPNVSIVRVEGEEDYSHARARNAGAAAAASEVLIFCDADTVLEDGAVQWLSDNLPQDAYGVFTSKTSNLFNKAKYRLAGNQLRGFQVISAEPFCRVEGFDEVLKGWGSGEDIEIQRRLTLLGISSFSLDPCIVRAVIEHDDDSRVEHYSSSIKKSYGAGLLYRTAKLNLLRLKGEVELPISTRRQLFELALRAAEAIGTSGDKVAMNVTIDRGKVLMPRQLGYERGTQSVSLRVELSLQDRCSKIHQKLK